MKKLTRILSTSLSVCSLLIFTHCTSTPVQSDKEISFAVVQGPTTQDTTQIAILHSKSQTVDVALKSGDDTFSPSHFEIFQRPFSDEMISQYVFSGLNAARNYELGLMSAGTTGDRRTLHLLADRSKVRWVMASCMDDHFPLEHPIWQEILDKRPDFIFLLGDNVYADKTETEWRTADEKQLWNRYAETRSHLPIFRTPSLVPIFATWDDHDLGTNDSNSTLPTLSQAQNTFKAFFPQSGIGDVYQKGPGVSSTFKIAHQRFILMDDRSFRSAPAPMGTHWGIEQEKWLRGILSQETDPVWLMNGDQFFGGYHPYESYERNHPENFKKFLGDIKSAAAPVFFVSGDRHLTELMKIEPKAVGYETYELTSSAVQATTFPDAWKNTPNPRKIKGASGTLNYVVVESERDAKTNGLSFQIKAYGPGNKALYDFSGKIKKK